MSRQNFLAYFFLTSCLVSGQSPRYVLKGQKVTLKKDITGQPDNILWTHNGNKVVEFNGREEHVYDPYKTRVTLDWLSAELDISDLRLEDSGKYELEVFVNKKLEKSYHDVEILDRVAKPTISCKINNSSSGTLVCSAEPRQPVHLMKFEWHSQGNVHPGPQLQISLGDELDDQVYSCMVSNPLTTETAAFTAKDCYTTKSSSVALIAIAVVIPLLLLIVGAGILYCCKKQKGCFAKRQTDVEKQKQSKGSGGTVETDEATPFIDGKSSSGKSSVGADRGDRGAVKEQLSKSVDEETQQVEPNSPTGVYPGFVKDQVRKIQSTANTGQNKDDINDKTTTVEDRLSEAPDKQEGHASNKLDSHAVSDDISQNTSSEQKFSTAPVSPALDQSSTDHDNAEASPSSGTPSDAADRDDRGAVKEQLSKSADEEKQQAEPNSPTVVSPEIQYGAGGTEPSDESADRSEDVSSEPTSSSTSDGSALDQNSTNHQNAETSPSSVPPSDAANRGDRGAVEEQLSKSVDEETQQAELKSPTVVSPDKKQHQPSDDSSVQKDSDGQQLNGPTEEEKPQGAGDPGPNDESDDSHKDVSSPTASDGSALDQNSTNHQNAETSPSSVPPSDAANRGDRGAVEEQLSKSVDEETQQAEPNSPTVVSPDKNVHHASDDSSVQKDSDGQQLNRPTEEEKPQGAGDPGPNDESDDSHKDVSSPTASDGSASDQKSADHQNTEASSSHASQNKDDINDKNTTVEDHFGKDPDKQEGHASDKSESPAESAGVNQNTSSEQKSSTAPSSPDKVLDPSNNDKSDSDSKQSSKDPLENASDSAAVGPVTGPDSEPQSAAPDNSKHPPSDNSSVQNLSDVQQLSKSADREKQQVAGDPELSDESAYSSEDVGSEVNSPTDISPGLVKRRSKKFETHFNTIIEKHMAE